MFMNRSDERVCCLIQGVFKRFVSSILFVAAVALLAFTIFSKQDTKSTPAEPTTDKINDALCKAGLGGGPDCHSDDDSAEVCTNGRIINDECCPHDRVNGETCCKSDQSVKGGICVCKNPAMIIDPETKECKCPTGQVLNEDGDACVQSCSLGQVDVNGVCCPNDRANQDNSICCPDDSRFENGQCECTKPNKIYNEGENRCDDAPAVECPRGQFLNKDGKTCDCLNGLEKDDKGNCCPDDRFWNTKGVCCPENAKSTNGGKCKCDDDNKVYNSTSNTCVPKHDAGTSKFQHTTILWALLGIIALICIFLLVLFFTRSDDKAAQGVVGPQGREKEADSDEVHGEYQFDHGRGEED